MKFGVGCGEFFVDSCSTAREQRAQGWVASSDGVDGVCDVCGVRQAKLCGFRRREFAGSGEKEYGDLHERLSFSCNAHACKFFELGPDEI